MRRQCKLFPPPPTFSLPHPCIPRRACPQTKCRSKNALKGNYRHRTLDGFLPAKVKESQGFIIIANWCGRVLSLLYYYKTSNTYIDLPFCKSACPHVRHGMQALQEKNQKYVFGRSSRSSLGDGRAAQNWSSLGLVVLFQQLFLEPEWAIDSEAMSARGIIVLVKSNQLVKNIENKKIQLVKARL